jgi:hypothetical protein
MDALGDDLLYDGTSGAMIPSTIFMGNIYIMRLKHMPEDKWNARAEGRKEQRTHQPTGGRGNQGGLRIGEMERDSIVGHGIMDFVRESYMKRADAYTTYVCNGCGTIPIYNDSKRLYVCPMCDGPVTFIGDSATTLELLPPSKRSSATFSKVEIPYATKVLDQELAFFLNMSMRMLTEKDVTHLRGAPLVELTADQQAAALAAKLPERTLLDTVIPERIEKKDEDFAVRPEDLSALGLGEEQEPELKPKVNSRVLNAAVEAAVNAALTTSTVPGRVNAAVVNAAVNAAIAASNAMPEEKPATAPVAPVAPTTTGGLQFTSAQAPPRDEGLGMDDYETFPEDSEVNTELEMPRRSQQQQFQQSQVNVQTSTQPVLVVPLNMAQQAPPAEYMGSATPGAPPTFSVDTSQRAMGAAGFAEPVARNRSASRSPGASRSSGPRAAPGVSQVNSNTAPATRVNVIKES